MRNGRLGTRIRGFRGSSEPFRGLGLLPLRCSRCMLDTLPFLSLSLFLFPDEVMGDGTNIHIS